VRVPGCVLLHDNNYAISLLLSQDLEQRFNWVTPEPGSEEAEAALDRAWLEVQAAQEG
jgi:hypothetical protein